jgi:hypothetical protein
MPDGPSAAIIVNALDRGGETGDAEAVDEAQDQAQ